MNKKDKINFGIIIFIAFILGGLTMYYFNINNKKTVYSDQVGNTCVSCNDTVIVENGSLSAAVEKMYKSVVMITTSIGNNKVSTGSGFVYKDDGKYQYIMTNHHVIADGTKWLITASDDTEIQGTVLGSDQYLDLAVVRVEKNKSLTAATINNKITHKLGDQVFTVGSPLGYNYRGTVTAGIISGVDRLVEVSVNSTTEDWVMQVIQIDAAVNPGNSGGPLVNAKGEVIGIISLKLVEASVENMGFAIPIDYAMKYIDNLENNTKINRPLLGVSMLNVDEVYALYRYGITIDSKITSGVVVVDVTNNNGASKAGLKKGDVITKFNDIEIKNSAFLKYNLYKYNVNDTVKVTYYRDGKYNTVNVVLTKNNY